MRLHRSSPTLLLACASLCGLACQLRRPVSTPARMIEPQLVLEPQPLETGVRQEPSSNALSIRLLDTQARGHIGRRILRHQPKGELTEDAVWRWSSSPDRYLDTALRIELTSNPAIRMVDSASVPTLAATLLEWHLESEGEPRLIGAVQFQFTGMDQVVHAQVVRASEPVSPELPGNVAVTAGNLLRRLASEGVQRLVRQR